ncbi:MAG TPA: hypothetical protein VH370_26515 [Humisphaera sp.]|jgi:hypothetical protein|nr:hypothetical protein [Humisphaera sp.]
MTDIIDMPDILRPAVYPILVTCIVASVWLLAGRVADTTRNLPAEFSEPSPQFQTLMEKFGPRPAPAAESVAQTDE